MARADFTDSLRAAQEGDGDAITSLFRSSNPALLRYLRHHAPHAAEDLLADTWLAAVKRLPSFRGDAQDFRAWLFAVARRRVADYHRTRLRRGETVGLGGLDDDARQDPQSLAVGALSAQQAIAALVRDLPHAQAEIVLLRVVADLDVSQVARITGRTPGSVRVLQHRALRRLEEIWDRHAVTG